MCEEKCGGGIDGEVEIETENPLLAWKSYDYEAAYCFYYSTMWTAL